MAGWLQQQSVSEVLLLGRTGHVPAADASLVTAPTNGAALTVAKADISLAEELHAALGTAQQGAPLQAILHASGVLADATLANQTLAGLRAVFAPKVLPAEAWQGRVAAQPATLQVLFSSVAAMLGAPGQANYSAANSALDAMALTACTKVSVGGTVGLAQDVLLWLATLAACAHGPEAAFFPCCLPH